MSFLNVQNIGTDRNASLVVDSRLIAEVLGVNHGDWVRNIIKKYQPEIEADFGQVRFENGYVNIPNGGKKETVYALLTEDQATCLMTYSKNTDQVRAAKRSLVKSFAKAKELLQNLTPEPIVLKPAIERVESLHKSLAFFGIDPSNPRFKQALQDIVGDTLGLSQPALPTSVDKWCGVAERAEQLGYSIALVTKHRSALGKAVKSQVAEDDRKMEDRLCNGSQRPICIYRITEDLDAAIEAFFAIKAVA